MAFNVEFVNEYSREIIIFLKQQFIFIINGKKAGGIVEKVRF